MEDSLVKKEITILKQIPSCSDFIDLCQLDLSGLNEPWVGQELLHQIFCNFTEILFKLQDVLEIPPLPFDFLAQKQEAIPGNSRYYVVELNGGRFFLKEMQYATLLENVIHEFFVGYYINQLTQFVPTFSYTFGIFSCTPSGCDYVDGEETDVAYILSQYIIGESLHDNIVSRKLNKLEAWHLIEIVIASIKLANKLYGFIHQDLRLGNIIIYELGQEFNIEIDHQNFTTRYLPVIYDFGRSQISVDGIIFSPSSFDYGVPATSIEYDMIYLIYDYARKTDQLDILGIRGQPIHYVSKKFSPTEVDRVYSKFSKLYPRKYKPTVKTLNQSQINISTGGSPCPQMPTPPNEQKYVEEKNRLLAARQKAELVKFIGGYLNIQDLEDYFELVKKYNLPTVNDYQLKQAHRNLLKVYHLATEIEKLIVSESRGAHDYWQKVLASLQLERLEELLEDFKNIHPIFK